MVLKHLIFSQISFGEQEILPYSFNALFLGKKYHEIPFWIPVGFKSDKKISDKYQIGPGPTPRWLTLS